MTSYTELYSPSYGNRMSLEPGPALNTDATGRTVAHGYVITGDEQTGYRGRAAVPLTASEVAYGVRELLFSGDLYDLLGQARAQLTVRSMVGGGDLT